MIYSIINYFSKNIPCVVEKVSALHEHSTTACVANEFK